MRQVRAESKMATEEYVQKYTKQNCGRPIECTDSHHYRSEMVPGITTKVSYCKLLDLSDDNIVIIILTVSWKV